MPCSPPSSSQRCATAAGTSTGEPADPGTGVELVVVAVSAVVTAVGDAGAAESPPVGPSADEQATRVAPVTAARARGARIRVILSMAPILVARAVVGPWPNRNAERLSRLRRTGAH